MIDRRGTGGIYINHHNFKDCVILSVQGSVNEGTAGDLIQAVSEIIEKKHLRKIVFRFLRKSRVSEPGLKVIKDIFDIIKGAKGHLVIVDEDSHLWRLRQSGLLYHTKVAKNVREAIELLG